MMDGSSSSEKNDTVLNDPKEMGQEKSEKSSIVSEDAVDDEVAVGKESAKKSTEAKKDGMRKGKWTPEEERYTNKVIEAFNAGLLKLSDSERGITLRAYLAAKLGCDPMRITKKYTGASCLGKRVYHAHKEGVSEQDINRTAVELQLLEATFRQKLMQMNRKRSNSNYSIDQYNHMISTPAIDALLKQGPPPGAGMWGNVRDSNGYPYSVPQYHPSHLPPGMYPPPAGYSYQGGPGGVQGYPPHIPPPHYAGGMYPMQYDPYHAQRREQDSFRTGQSAEKGESSEFTAAPQPPSIGHYGYPPNGYYSSMAAPYPGYAPPHYTMHVPLLPQQKPDVVNESSNSTESQSGEEDCAKKRPRTNSQKENSSSTPYLTSMPGFQIPVKSDSGGNDGYGGGNPLARRAINVPLEASDRLKTSNRDGESGEAANSLLGFFNHLEKNNSQQDLVEFFEGVQKSAASAISPANKKAK